MRRLSITLALTVLALSGCAKPPIVYRGDSASIQRQVSNMLPTSRLNMALANYGGAQVDRVPEEGRLLLSFTQDGTQIGRYIISFAQDEEGTTRVTGRYEKGETPKLEGDHIDATRYVAEVLVPLVAQSVERHAAKQTFSEDEMETISTDYFMKHRAEQNAVTQRAVANIGAKLR